MEESEDEGIPLTFVSRAERKRKARILHNIEPVKNLKIAKATDVETYSYQPVDETPLIEVAAELRKKAEIDPDILKSRHLNNEENLLKGILATNTTLKSHKEVATGLVKFKNALDTGWKPKRKLSLLTSEEIVGLREKYNLLVEGEDIPMPCKRFSHMNLPKSVHDALIEKNILKPTPIQVQALPAALKGRDLVGIASTGSGKTVSFLIPAIILALGMERKLSLDRSEGPVALVLGPSRELQRQTFQVCNHFLKFINKEYRSDIKSMLVIGGDSDGLKRSLDLYKRKGTHIVIATPGKLIDLLKKKILNLLTCCFLCLDEGDRMTEDPFDVEVQQILDFFHPDIQRQTLLFSATMPRKCVEFARNSLIKPIIVRSNRAGAVNLNVLQHFVLVENRPKLSLLLDVLQKTAPPVLVFCEKQSDVDEVCEYFLLKGVDACAVHGGKSQGERNRSIDEFRSGNKDVLVATDVAAKGLDFALVQHVINYDVPKEIENYVHRIGRTGRSGKKGVATTLIDHEVEPDMISELEHLLIEANQEVPQFMASGDMDVDRSTRECSYCGGLGHTISSCPRLKQANRAKQNSTRDNIGGGW